MFSHLKIQMLVIVSHRAVFPSFPFHMLVFYLRQYKFIGFAGLRPAILSS